MDIGINELRTAVTPLLLGTVSVPVQVGYFRAGQAPLTGLTALTAPARLVLITEQTRDWEAGASSRVFAGLRRYSASALAAMVVSVPFLYWWMPTLIRIVFTDKYAPAADAARLMLLAGAIGLVFAWTKSLPVSVGRPELRIATHGIETIVLIPLVLVLGSIWDATGAAAATGTTGKGAATTTAAPKPRVTRDIKEVWVDYKKNKTEQLRNILMENYLHLVRYNAERIHVKLPDEVELDDLMSAGIFGLMDAINAFDLERGVKFETYCAPRIRGAILDELRAMDWVPRLVRNRAHRVEQVSRLLEAELGRPPTEPEMALRLKLPEEEFEKLIRDASAVSVVSLSRKYFETDSSRDVREIDVLEDRRSDSPVIETQKRDLKELITRGLSRAERLILILYYYEEMTMKEIGATLDLSESRVSQMHSAILKRLKEQLEVRRKELVNA